MNTVEQNSEERIWDLYNGLLLSADIDRLRKMFVRYDLFRQSLQVPGDIVECGVFKGTGVMFWLKLLAIYSPASSKRVVGFDTFGSFADDLLDYERVAASKFVEEAAFRGTDPDLIRANAAAAGLAERVELVEGDIARTGSAYVAERPGFRISLLHLDLDAFAGTRAALEAFYDRVVKGGIIVCDEYGSPEWGESQAVDEFFSGRNVTINAVPHSYKPTAYIVKG